MVEGFILGTIWKNQRSHERSPGLPLYHPAYLTAICLLVSGTIGEVGPDTLHYTRSHLQWTGISTCITFFPTLKCYLHRDNQLTAGNSLSKTHRSPTKFSVDAPSSPTCTVISVLTVTPPTPSRASRSFPLTISSDPNEVGPELSFFNPKTVITTDP